MPSSLPPPRRVQPRLRRRPAGDQSGDTVWLFDLDNTLHDASHAIFPAINRLMTAYVARVLGCDEATASRVRVDYWQRYGATLLGMIRHHGVDPADFLRAAHEFPELADMVRVRRGLAAHLRRLPGRKIIVTNAPQAYARAVLDIAGIGHCFERVVAIEQMWVHGHLRPKPDRRMLRRLLAQTASRRTARCWSKTRCPTSSATPAWASARPGLRAICARSRRRGRTRCPHRTLRAAVAMPRCARRSMPRTAGTQVTPRRKLR